MSISNAKFVRRQTASTPERAAFEAQEAIRRLAERRERVALSDVAFLNGWRGGFRILAFDLGAARICVAVGDLDATLPATNVKVADLAADFRPVADLFIPAIGRTGGVDTLRHLSVTADGVVSASSLSDDSIHVSGLWLAGR